jgi:hypothetical protein
MGGGEQISPESSWMTLAQAIGGIRAELTEAMGSGKGEQLQFDVGDVELEFVVDVRRDRNAQAGVRVWVVELGGSGGTSRGVSNRLKVTLHPVHSATGGTPRVADHVEALPPRRGSQ